MADISSSEIEVSCPQDCNGEADRSNYAEILVIRHGETVWNSEGRIQGHLDVELNEAGRQQAFAVADQLSTGPKISAVYSSDLKRALETAQIIAKSCGCAEVIEDQDLRERHLGDLQGRLYSEMANECPEAYKAFKSPGTDKTIPGGGESLDQLYQRCTSAVQRIAQKHIGERVVVVSHGGSIRTLHERATRIGRPGKILNTSINTFHISDGGDRWIIKKWGDVAHLEKTGFLKSGFGGDKDSG